jgi:hypothetical protein
MHWNSVVQKLTFQGDFVKLLIEEETNVTWKSMCNNIPRGILSFALKAATNGLNTPDNLKRWGIRKTEKCELCKNFSNLEHILNWCPVALNQGRFTWRHDSVLSHMTSELKKGLKGDATIYADLPEHSFNGGTIPPDILTTAQRPDIVIIERKSKRITILELTCSFEKNIESANQRKAAKYLSLKEDLKDRGWTTNYIPFEVGSRGQVTKRNKDAIAITLRNTQIKLNKTKLITELGKIALLCSFSIFQAHCQPAWQTPPFLAP